MDSSLHGYGRPDSDSNYRIIGTAGRRTTTVKHDCSRYTVTCHTRTTRDRDADAGANGGPDFDAGTYGNSDIDSGTYSHSYTATYSDRYAGTYCNAYAPASAPHLWASIRAN